MLSMISYGAIRYTLWIIYAEYCIGIQLENDESIMSQLWVNYGYFKSNRYEMK